MTDAAGQDTATWREVAPRVLVRTNPGFGMNTGLVIGDERALIIDTGAGPRQGCAILTAVRERTDLPLIAVNTHAHFDHYFGNAVLAANGVEDIWATSSCAAAISEHGNSQRPAVAALEAEMAACEKLGLPARWEESLPLPFPVTGAIGFSGQAQFHPLKLAAHIAKGLQIFENTKALAFLGNQVQTPKGTISAENIIVATHFPMLNKHGTYFLKLYQQRSYVIALENAPGIEGMYLDCAENGLSIRSAGQWLLLGGGGHRTGKEGLGWRLPELAAEKFYPKAQIAARWATQDCMSLDGMPYIGRYSKATPHLYVATGFQKWGMSSSMLSAMLLTDLIQGKENPYAELFSPSRSMLHKQLLCNGVETTMNLLRPTKPRCPHLGCALRWNKHEHSWDCPCHGSRFDEDGTLLDNPATGNLKKKP